MLKTILFLFLSFSLYAANTKTVSRSIAKVWYPEGGAPSEKEINLLRELNRYQTTTALDCARQPVPPVGTHRLMHRQLELGSKGNALGYETGHYLLRNVSASKVQAVIQLEFVPWKSGKQEHAKLLQNRTRSCLKELTPYLKGPNGEQLEILALTPSEAEKLPQEIRPEKRVIKVSKEAEGYRGNAEEFGTNFDCITIGHEILHHLGLADEYREMSPEMKDAWACRQVTITPSYMRNMWAAFNLVVPHKRKCECDSMCKQAMSPVSKTKHIFLSKDMYDLIEGGFDEQFCETKILDQKSIEEIDQPQLPFLLKSQSDTVTVFESRRATGESWIESRELKCTCPRGFSGDYCRKAVAQLVTYTNGAIPRSICPNGAKQIELLQIGEFHEETRIEGNQLILISEGGEGSLLRSQHFKKIMAGNCRNPSSPYEKCSQYAYLPLGQHCSDKPKQCSDDSYFLDGKVISLPSFFKLRN